MAHVTRYRYGKRHTARTVATGVPNYGANGSRVHVQYSLSLTEPAQPDDDAERRVVLWLDGDELVGLVRHAMKARDLCDLAAKVARDIEQLCAKDAAQLRIP